MNAISTWKRVLATSALLTAVTLGNEAVANSPHAAACSNASLTGSYGFYRTGSTSVGPLAALGLLTFDGAGTLTGSQSVSRNGAFQFDMPIAGLYVVNADCTGKFLGPDGVTEIARVVVTDRGNGFYIFSESAGNAVYGVGRRIAASEDSGD